MVLIPDYSFGIFNGWLIFFIYIAVFSTTVFTFPKEVRARLYDRSLWNPRQKALTIIGKSLTLVNLVLIVMSPIRLLFPFFHLGILLWGCGVIGLVLSLITYGRTPMGTPVIGGLYKISRNPQVFSIWILFIGICFAIGSGISLILMGLSLIFLHQSILAEEKSCIEQYGESYKSYMENCPRYFLFF